MIYISSILTESYALYDFFSDYTHVTEISKTGSHLEKNTLGNESQGLLVVKLCYRCIEAFTSDAYLLAAGLVLISATSAEESKS